MTNDISNTNEAINAIFAGKEIESVDATASNCWDFYFRDGSKVTIEVEAIAGHMGFYGISIADQNFDPRETIGPGRKPGDARKTIE